MCVWKKSCKERGQCVRQKTSKELGKCLCNKGGKQLEKKAWEENNMELGKKVVKRAATNQSRMIEINEAKTRECPCKESSKELGKEECQKVARTQ